MCSSSLADLDSFIKSTECGLLKRVEKGDFQGLVEIMGHLVTLKERQSSTDDMFEPLKQTIELLKSYEQELPETVFKQLEVSAFDHLLQDRRRVLGFQRAYKWSQSK